jgi:hypothetical protein
MFVATQMTQRRQRRLSLLQLALDGEGITMSPVIRILLIAASYLAASLGAGCALSLGMLYLSRSQSGELLRVAASPDLNILMVVIAVSSEVIAVLALLPAMPVIVYSERRGVRSFWFYAYAGALIGPMSYLLFVGISTLSEPNKALGVLAHSLAFPGWGIWLLTAFSGFFAGLIYWLMAGRSAGIQRTCATLPARS